LSMNTNPSTPNPTPDPTSTPTPNPTPNPTSTFSPDQDGKVMTVTSNDKVLAEKLYYWDTKSNQIKEMPPVQ